VLGIAASSGRNAAVGVGAANELNSGHDAGTGDADGFEEKPRNGTGLRGRAVLEDLALDGAAVTGFPDGPGSVCSYDLAGGVDERGFGGLEDPLRAGSGLLADVNLHAFAGGRQDGTL